MGSLALGSHFMTNREAGQKAKLSSKRREDGKNLGPNDFLVLLINPSLQEPHFYSPV